MSSHERLTATSSQDVLSIIPFNLGFWPRSSLVCLGLAGSSVRATLRVDLPDGGCRDPEGIDRYVQTVGESLRLDECADGTLLAVYTDEDWDGTGARPHPLLLDALLPALASWGLPVKDAWHLGPAHWRHLQCRRDHCCPVPGHEVRSITGSTMTAELVYAGRSFDRDPRARAAQCLEPLPAEVQNGIRRSADAAADRLAGRLSGGAQFNAVLKVWQLSLLRWPKLPDDAVAGYLVASLHSVAVRDAVLVMAAAGIQTAMDGAWCAGLLVPATGRAFKPTMPAATAAERARIAGDAERDKGWDGADFGVVLMAGTADAPGSAAAPSPDPAAIPNWDRMDCAEQLLGHLARAAEGSARAAALTMIGWIQWCKGRSSVAGTYLHLALAEQPGYRLAALLDALLEQGCISGWARNPATAWRQDQRGIG
ncbi:DUF4192 family protein [Arthrobacter sp. 35W]|uniref:DUF4192 family protein n=1 Tax=Arthrobacter sp. 35W TaxID=1132441 RepID=UPI00041A481F|nr:DUF4192 family protein [Arthrobacter sp. 35W]